ncbi:unnamed protein product [Microthlaspi erraticum]|uniref:BAH domain-containing protein n=1 Tax=Microthlaspi erraticum TaxID=1685480 RepID=A0A6D2INK8_9BRAS|nr:unnamed protein product [Microthlaspi erraticum]
MFTKEMLTEQFSQVLISKDEDSGKDIVSLSRSEDSKDNAEQTVRKQTMQKNKNTEKRPMEKKKELQWKRENCAQPVGKVIKFTGHLYKGKEGYVKLVVQWFYRPEDVEEEYLGKWESKGARDLFYSFHRDEVFAESVKHNCIVHFVPDNKKVPEP